MGHWDKMQLIGKDMKWLHQEKQKFTLKMSKQYGHLAILQLIRGEGGELGQGARQSTQNTLQLRDQPAQINSSPSACKCSNITVEKRKGNVCMDTVFCLCYCYGRVALIKWADPSKILTKSRSLKEHTGWFWQQHLPAFSWYMFDKQNDV